MQKPILSIVTAALNVGDDIPKLIQSLQAQSDPDFEWVVADGKSTDKTISVISLATDLNINITSQDDFGIYDALNRAIKSSRGTYYLVMGATDTLRPDAVRQIKSALANDPSIDILTGRHIYKGHARGVRRTPDFISNQFAHVSGHAVSSIFRKDLHERFGYYSNRFPIAADEHFTMKVVRAGAKIVVIDDVLGSFSDDGVSNDDVAGVLMESFRIQLKYHPRWLCVLLLVLRLLKHYRTLK